MKFLRFLLKAAGSALVLYIVFYAAIVILLNGQSEDSVRAMGYATGLMIGALIRLLWLPVLALGAIWFLLRRLRPAARP